MTGTPRAARGARDVLLRARHPLERHLETEIAARHHHRVARRENLVEVLERLRPFELGHQRHVAGVGVDHHLAGPAEIRRGLHEADAPPCRRRAPGRTCRSSMSFGVIADAGSGTPGALIPLCSPSSPPSTTVVWISVPSVDSTRSSIRPSESSRRSPGRTLRARPSNVGRDASGFADEVPGADPQRVAGLQRSGLSIDERAGSDLRPAQILQDRDLAAAPARAAARTRA